MSRLDELNALSENPDLWNDPEKAQGLMKERTRLDNKIQTINTIEKSLNENIEMIALAEEEGDESLVLDSEALLTALKERTDKLQLESLLSGEVDGNDAFLEVHSGSGGTEAQDWAEMLLRMYIRWSEAHGYSVTTLEVSSGEEAGLKSATIRVSGENAYGWLKMENGVHRLVRISPYDSNSRRHTSFASIGVSPVIDDDIDIVIEDKDLRVDTYRSSGAGGQHVNTTDSAVRITHDPTGTVVACQSERSQHQNRANAMIMLKAKLYEREIRLREEKQSEAYGEKTDIGWGHQIRSYVLHPYQMVKDLRTNYESTNSAAILDGDLDDFLEAALSQIADNKSNS